MLLFATTFALLAATAPVQVEDLEETCECEEVVFAEEEAGEDLETQEIVFEDEVAVESDDATSFDQE